MKEEIRSSETSLLTWATQRNIPVDGIVAYIMRFNNSISVKNLRKTTKAVDHDSRLPGGDGN
jgi:hypothetical protein